jgi:hypothetical protein
MVFIVTVYSCPGRKTTAEARRLWTKKIRNQGGFLRAGIKILAYGKPVFLVGWRETGSLNYLIKDKTITANSQRPVSAAPNIKTPSAILLILSCN